MVTSDDVPEIIFRGILEKSLLRVFIA